MTNVPPQTPPAHVWPPIPDADLAKGSTLTPERLVELGAIRAPMGSSKWAFALLRLRDEIQTRHRLSVRILKGGLHVHTDPEASAYHNGRGEGCIETIKKQVSNLYTLVDTARLSSAEQAKHDRSLCLWGARITGIKLAAKAADAADQPRIE